MIMIKILYINENALQLFGIKDLVEVNKKSIFNLCHTEDEMELKEIYLDIINNKKIQCIF